MENRKLELVSRPVWMSRALGFQQVPCGLEQKVSGGGGRAGHVGRSAFIRADLPPEKPYEGSGSAQERQLWDWSFQSSLEANRITFVMWEASTFLTIIPGIKELA